MDYSEFRLKNFYDSYGKRKASPRARPAFRYDEDGTQPQEAASEQTGAPDDPVRFRDPRQNDLGAYRDPRKSVRSARPKRKAGPELFAVIAILVCFLIVVASTQFLGGGSLIGDLQSAINPVDGTPYYFVASEGLDSEQAAIARASVVRAGGGAGYIYYDQTAYFVVIATYFDKSSADAVSRKNDSTVVIQYSVPKATVTGLNVRDAAMLVDTLTYLDTTLRDLDRIVTGLESLSMSDSEAIKQLASFRNELLNYKDKLYQQGGGALQRSLDAVDPLFGGLDAILTSNNRSELASGLRYITAVTIAAMRNAAIGDHQTS